MNKKKFLVLTSINKITPSIRNLSKLEDYNLVLIGDQKTPDIKSKNLEFLSLKDQEKLPFKFINHCPVNSYQRKNIGYLYSISNGADIIFETDDDNSPLKNWDECLNFKINKIKTIKSPKIFNSFSFFTKEKIWPRGYPLSYILKKDKIQTSLTLQSNVGIWQGLVNHDPDVDAIYRLTNNKKIIFSPNLFALDKGVFCPFNSQNTFWFKEYFFYLYLPISTTFRMTDILRGYIAQRCLWEHNACLGFFGPNMKQVRNKHNLLSDFSLEIPCYTQVETIINFLSKIQLSKSPQKNLKKIYSKLLELEIIKDFELFALDAWIEDLENIFLKRKLYS